MADGLASGSAERPALRAAAWSTVVVLGLAVALAGLQSDISSSRLIALLVLSPFVEEVIFRAGVQQVLHTQLQGAEAVAGASLVFALTHVLVQGQPQAALVVLPSLLIGTVYARSRRLGDAVALHVAMNAAWLAFGLFHGPVVPGV